MTRTRRDTTLIDHVRGTLTRPGGSHSRPRARPAALSSVLESLARWENEGGAAAKTDGDVPLRSQPEHAPGAGLALGHDAVVQRVR